MLYLAIAAGKSAMNAIRKAAMGNKVDTTVKSPEEAEELLGLPVLGRMPALKGKGN